MTDRARVRIVDRLRVRVSGPLAPFKVGFAEELRRLGTHPARRNVPAAGCRPQPSAQHRAWTPTSSCRRRWQGLADRRAASYAHHLQPGAWRRCDLPTGAEAVPRSASSTARGAAGGAALSLPALPHRRAGFKEKTAQHYATRSACSWSSESHHKASSGRGEVSAFVLHCARRQTPGTAKHTWGRCAAVGFLHHEA